ncbi:MAG: metallophosphoesterase [Candidatus Izemoplasmatales bacterium]
MNKRSKAFLILSVLDFAVYLSMKSIWSGIRGMTGVPWLAVFLFFLLLLIAVARAVLVILKKKTVAADVLGGLSVVLTIVLGYMFYLGIGSFKYFARAFGDILTTAVFLIAGWLFVERYPKSSCARKRWYRRALYGFFATIVVLISFNLSYPFLKVQPTVYAVDREYQIVWSTSSSATGTVTVGGVVYGDEYAGSLRSEETVHKVSVPMAVLDSAGSYEISSTHYLYRGPYSGVAGATVSKTYAFDPVDSSDGEIAQFTLSDVHEWRSAAVKAARSAEDLELLVLAGDISSTYESVEDLEFIGKLAWDVAAGRIPVVFARGNHDVKGVVADRLHRYVGASATGDFYYTFFLSGIAGVVLDLGEDHADDWWEFYGTADYGTYRAEQTAYLEDLVAEDAFSDPAIDFRVAVCHMPIALVEANGFLADVKTEWTGLLNDLGVDMVFSGHLHELYALTPDTASGADHPLSFVPAYGTTRIAAGYRTDADFTNFVAARRSDVQDYAKKERLFGGAYTGLHTVYRPGPGTAISSYLNSQGTEVVLTDPFTGAQVTSYLVETD